MNYREQDLNLSLPGGRPAGMIRCSPEAFRVEELMVPELDGQGEHLWIKIEKRGLDTQQVIRTVARSLAIGARDIGYSGLKDRHSVAVQWLSIPLSRACRLNENFPENPDLSLLETRRCRRKLRKGSHRHNRFNIIIDQLNGGAHDCLARFENLFQQGFPNYFGPQRFGRRGDNVRLALSWFRGEARAPRQPLRGLLISAARSHLFNNLLSLRVADGSWNRLVQDDVAVLSGSNSFFQADHADPVQVERCRQADIHPGGILAGRIRELAGPFSAGYWQQVARQHGELIAGLQRNRVDASIRALRAWLHDPHGEVLDEASVRLSFSLQRGVFATSLIREVCDYRDQSTGATSSMTPSTD